jgi:hypothetical protein
MGQTPSASCGRLNRAVRGDQQAHPTRHQARTVCTIARTCAHGNRGGPGTHILPLICGRTAETVSSRIDDILMSKKPCKAQVEVLKEGTLRPRASVTLQTQSTGLYIPTQTEPRRAEPTTRLVLPISVADIEAFTNRLRSLTEARSRDRRTTQASHGPPNTHVMPHLRAIEAQDGKASARLTDINGTPATIVVAGAADQLQNILSAAHNSHGHMHHHQH